MGRAVHARGPGGDDGHELARVVALPPRDGRAPGAARRDQRRGRQADARPLRDRPARRAGRGGRGAPAGGERPAPRRGLVLEPGADRRRAPAARARRPLRRHGVLGGGGARQAGPRRLPRGGTAPGRRPGEVRRDRGLRERDPRGPRGRDARDRLPEPALPARTGRAPNRGRRGRRCRRRGRCPHTVEAFRIVCLAATGRSLPP